MILERTPKKLFVFPKPTTTVVLCSYAISAGREQAFGNFYFAGKEPKKR